MALVPIRLKPGIDIQSTPLLNSGGWSASENIRFFQQLPQKDGGYVSFTHALPGAGSPNAMRAWTALSGISYLAIACSLRLDLFVSNQVVDITPLTVTTFPPASISVTAGSTTATINDAISPTPAVGENIEVHDPVSVGGVVLQGPYTVASLVAGGYTITLHVTANATETGGAVRQLTTTIGQAQVAVELPSHGLYNGQTTSFPDPTAIGGITLLGNYAANVIDPNRYTITATTKATFSTTVAENNGSIQITFTHPPTGGVQGDFRNAVSTLANWGELLFWNPRGGPVYQWNPELGITGNIATDITTAPQSNSFIFVATQQQQLFCCGTTDRVTGLFDPMLVRWSDVLDYTDFVPSTTNQAGSFRLSAGSTLIGGLALAGGNLIWSDLALYSAQYLGFPLVWGFQPIGLNCGLIGPKAFGTLSENIFWMSKQQFYQLVGGAPQVLPCSIWDLVFKNLDKTQTDYIVCETNSYFNEVSWEVPQKDGTVTRARVDITTGLWNYTILPSRTFLPRTAWIDQSVFGAPLGADTTGAVWQHETGADAGDAPLKWKLKTGLIMISEGDDITFMREFLPDFKWSADEDGLPGPGVIELTIYFFNDSQEPPSIKGPYMITSNTRAVPVNGRGRSIEFECGGDDLGSQVRVGDPRYRGQPDGRQ